MVEQTQQTVLLKNIMYHNTNGPQPSFSGNFGNGFLSSFKSGSALTRLIYINCGLFFAITLVSILFLLGGAKGMYYALLLEWLGAPAEPQYLLYRPWTLLTYMFTHFSFLHLLFNMLWLYWFGNFFLTVFSERQLTAVYLLGGIAGAVLFILCYNLLPHFDQLSRLSSWAIGASASVMAIVFAVCIYLPQHQVYIFLLGPVKLIYLALFTAFIDFLSIGSVNAGGHIAHLGGALLGCLFAWGMRSNRDCVSWIIGPAERLKRNRPASRGNMRVKYRQPAGNARQEKHEHINDILDKISRSGYESLTREEKEALFKSGR